MAYCASCGNPLAEGQQFCGNCGQPVGQGGPAAPPGAYAPPTAGAPYAAGQPYSSGQGYPPGQPYGPGPGYGQPNWAAPQKRRGTGLWIALAALVVVIAVACILVFVVFQDDIFGGGGGSTPEDTVTQLLDAMEDKNIDKVFALMDQGVIVEMLGEDFLDEAKDAMSDELFGGESVKFSNIEMSTEETGEDTATVSITAGSVTMTDSDGEETVEDVSEADEPVTFDVVKKDGSWYLDPTTFDLF